MHWIKLNRRHWWYSPVFALINWLEATVELLFLGTVSLGWVMDYARWYAVREIKRRGQTTNETKRT